MERWLSYDQISLIPTQVSTLKHRVEADTSVQFGPIRLGLPLIAAPMPDVSNGAMTKRLRELGSFGWIHRFQTEFEVSTEVRWSGFENAIDLGLAVSFKPDYVQEYYKLGVRIFCIDTANGASTNVQEALGRLKDKYPDIFIVVGNVASAENFQKLEEWGADAIRVGIAGGSVCETRTETGVYSPMSTAIMDIACKRKRSFVATKSTNGKWHQALLIADGGIRTPADFCKALALGADLVMAGGIFAGSKESPGEIMKIDGKLVKILRGAASYSVQKGNSGYNEGAETIVPYQGSVEKVVNRFAAGLRSSMSYMNARTLSEYRNNVKVVEVDGAHRSS